jgi:DNA-binding NtrC family response regulator
MGDTTPDDRRQRKEAALANLVGQSPIFLELLASVRRIARVDGTVLIEGETGTGKELIGRAIHYLSHRAPMPFVPVNCGALPDTLLEAELFGHERGAFTGAQQERPGLIRAAEGGTLCLDEIESLSARAQVALLRLLQDGTFRKLGSVREHTANVRFLAMSNRALTELVRDGVFRADLFYRLSVFSVRLPALRERRADIVPLAYHFLRKYPRAAAPVTEISRAARRLLEAHAWPGNVRELENTMYRTTQMAGTSRVEPEDLAWPGREQAQDGRDLVEAGEDFKSLKRRTIDTFERAYLTRLMEICRGNVTQAARMAGKERRDLGRLLKKHRILPTAYVG